MPLKVTRRASNGALTITGTVAGTRIRRRAQSDDPKLAAEEAATIEADLLRAAWHGERRGARSFAEAVTSYLEAAPRTESTKARVRRLLLALGTAGLAEIDQGTIARLKPAVLRPGASPATVSRGVKRRSSATSARVRSRSGAGIEGSSCRGTPSPNTTPECPPTV